MLVLKYHPDKGNLDDAKFHRIQKAWEVLSNEKEKKVYDQWLRSKLDIPYKVWRSKQENIIHWKIKHDNPQIKDKNEPKDVLEQFRNYEI